MAVSQEQVAVMIGTLQLQVVDLKSELAAKKKECEALTAALQSTTQELLKRAAVEQPCAASGITTGDASGGCRGGGDAGVHASHDDEAAARLESEGTAYPKLVP